jgi:hypothetical protein
MVTWDPPGRMADGSQLSASGPRAVKQIDDLKRLTRAARVEAAYLRSISLDIRKQRRSALALAPRRHRDR